MGSNQSSRREREFEYREYDARSSREPAATAKDVEKALETQRKIYEQRMKDILKETKATSPTTNQNITATTSFERQRTPYAFTTNDLQTKAPANSNAPNLYPTLSSGNSTLAPGNTFTPISPCVGGYGAVGGPYQRTASDFSFVNNHFVPPQHLPVSPVSNQCFQPSAPPVETSSVSSRSRSRQRGDPDADITCFTCGQTYGERIYQCNQGHSSCELCKTRQVACGQCRQQITDRRNFDLEKYVSERKVKCPNSDEGCRLFIKIADMGLHEKECPFKALACPSLGSFCPWKGNLSQLLDHFESMHPMHRQAEVDKEMFLSNVNDPSHTMHYINIGTFHFLFHLKVSKNAKVINMTVQMIGTKNSAAKWAYEVHVYNKSQPRRKFKYIDRCSSSTEPVQDIIETMKCATIPLEYAKTFICSGALAYKFYIKRDHEIKMQETKSNIRGKNFKRQK